MFALADILSARWILFIAAVLLFLALDLGVFHRRPKVMTMREGGAWTAICVVASLLFGYVVAPNIVEEWGAQQSVEFVTGYVLELSLSMDNVFVIALIFSYFRVPTQFQHRVLFWGILGALVMRGLMIWAGVEMVTRFKWMLEVLGAFLILTGGKMLLGKEDDVQPEKNFAIRVARRFFPVSSEFHGQRFFTRLGARWALTPLALVLLMVETTDLIFALDSIPAIFGVTTNPYVVFTSNVFAILGLRSLYFVLAGAIGYFKYLKFGLAVVLVFIGVKMVLGRWLHFSTTVSLTIVGGIILASILASVLLGRREAARARRRASVPTP